MSNDPTLDDRLLVRPKAAGTVPSGRSGWTPPRRTLVVCGHPHAGSFCQALADAYVDGARAAGLVVELLRLAECRFDPELHASSPKAQRLEPDLQYALEEIERADHLVFVYPAWWGTGPARLKGFLDRTLLPGRAFVEREDGRHVGLLEGKTAHLIITLDMPVWVYRWIQGAPGFRAMKRSVLGFCGVRTTRMLALGPLRHSTVEQRGCWLETVRRLGFALSDGALGSAGRFRALALDWLAALRLQFYAVPLLAYSAAMLGALASGHRTDMGTFIAGYGALFFLEAATVFTNDHQDFDSDRANPNHSLFTGGSRVAVEGRIERDQLARAALYCAMLGLACAGIALPAASSPAAAALVILGLLVLGLGYTAPPLRLSWRGLGEVTVAFTHSFCVVLWGWLLAGGAWDSAFPWLLAIPMFVGILPAITLSAIPDLQADRSAGKRTFAVRYGSHAALLASLVATVAAALIAIGLSSSATVQDAYAGLLALVLPHALLLSALIVRTLGVDAPEAGRIDGLMFAALGFIAWFAIVPVANLW